jgi:hypothetical protein
MFYVRQEPQIYYYCVHDYFSRDRVSVGARYYTPIQTGPVEAQPPSYTMATGSISQRYRGQGVALPIPSGAKVKERLSYFKELTYGSRNFLEYFSKTTRQ